MPIEDYLELWDSYYQNELRPVPQEDDRSDADESIPNASKQCRLRVCKPD